MTDAEIELNKQVLHWFQTGETGVSSKAMAAAVTGERQREKWSTHPLDPDDLNRCLKFLRACPAAKARMDRVAAISDVWARLVDNWSLLESTFTDEVGIDWAKGRNIHAVKTYSLMRRLIENRED